MNIHTNTIKKIFPKPSNDNYNNLKCDEEGLYSITHKNEADIITKNIINIMGTNDLNIIDMTAGCGGNMISFIKNFTHTTGIEINNIRFNLLKQNLSNYNYNKYELILDDSVNIKNEYDVYFIDPPWGGPEYKINQNIELYLSNINIKDYILLLPKEKLIVLKLPFNYNIDVFNNIIKKIILNNIVVLFIRT